MHIYNLCFIHLFNWFFVCSVFRVNDRINSVNGVSLENVEYSTAVQVLRDSGNTVTLVIKRRVPHSLNMISSPSHSHQHSIVSAINNNLINNNNNNNNNINNINNTTIGSNSSQHQQQQTIKIVLNKSSKKDDFGLVLGTKLFVKVSCLDLCYI